MSIIAGILHFDGGPAERSHVEAMTSWMAERAPDGISHWQGSGAALGAGLLRTTPESLEEAQPLTSEDGNLVLVMDGRVDNWEELRASLLDEGMTLRYHGIEQAARTFRLEASAWIPTSSGLCMRPRLPRSQCSAHRARAARRA